MVSGVPVLRQDDGLEVFHQRVDAGHDLVAIVHRQPPAGAEIILDINDDEGMTGILHLLAPAALSLG